MMIQRDKLVSYIPNNATATGGLPTTLILGKGAKVMLTVNVDVCECVDLSAILLSGVVTGEISNYHSEIQGR